MASVHPGAPLSKEDLKSAQSNQLTAACHGNDAYDLTQHELDGPSTRPPRQQDSNMKVCLHCGWRWALNESILYLSRTANLVYNLLLTN
eukprot:5602582-Amphidinium_carterae.1